MYGRSIRSSAECSPVAKIDATPVENRTWRMKQLLLSWQQFEDAQALLSKPDLESRLRGIALVLHGKFNAVGWPYMNTQVMTQMTSVVKEIYEDPKCFTTIVRPNGAFARSTNMKLGDYILVLAADALTASLMWGMVSQHAAADKQLLAEASAGVVENANRVLMRLSGNLGSTLTNADGSPSSALLSGGATAIHSPEGAVPAHVVMTVQLTKEYDLHPKKIAWMMQELLYTVSKGRAHNQRDAPSQQAAKAAADAMVAMASTDSGIILDPKETAAAALAATTAAQTLGRGGQLEFLESQGAAAMAAGMAAGMLPVEPVANLEQAQVQLLQHMSVKELKHSLVNFGVDHSHCVEKAELVELLAKHHSRGTGRSQQQQQQQPPPQQQQQYLDDPDLTPPCDIRPWLHMALFFRAEAGETAQGRSAAVQDMYRAAVAAVRHCPGGDELYELLIASNVLRVLVDGGTPFKAGEGLQLLDWSVSAKAKLKSWLGYDLVAPRVRSYFKSTETNLKDLVGFARREARQHPSSSSSSGGGGLIISNAEVRQLLQPHEEGLLLRPHPSRARAHIEMVSPQGPPPKSCANCEQYFHKLQRCNACKSVEYCGRECQLAHWKAHKAQCKKVQQEKEAADAAGRSAQR